MSDRLDVQNILGAVGGLDAEVEVLLQGNADEAGHRILRRVSQRVGIHRCCWRCLRGNRSSLRANGRLLCHQRQSEPEQNHQCPKS